MIIGRVWFPRFLWAGTTDKGHGVICVEHRSWFGFGRRRVSVFVSNARPSASDSYLNHWGWRDSLGNRPVGRLSFDSFERYWNTTVECNELRRNVVPREEEGWTGSGSAWIDRVGCAIISPLPVWIGSLSGLMLMAHGCAAKGNPSSECERLHRGVVEVLDGKEYHKGDQAKNWRYFEGRCLIRRGKKWVDGDEATRLYRERLTGESAEELKQ